jgi:cysteine desulfurase
MTVVNHETGVVQPIEAIAKPAHRLGAFMHVDAVQALGKLPVIRWNCWDSVAVAAHKIRGPKGIGALAWKCGRPTPTPLLVGGAQERGLRAGTVDPVLIAGFGVALERLVEYSSSIVELAKLRDLLESEMSPSVESNIPVHVERLGHVASLHVRGWSAEELVAALDLEGICVSSGSACAAGTSEASPVIASMLGLERARSTIRISLGETTSESEIRRTIEVFQRVLRRT